ncbi:MAG: metallophosphoesterase [Candidatus Nitrosocaldaceae archaeon]
MKVRVLYPHPALLLSNKERYVVISDLHIGFEEEYRKRGIFIDDNYIYEMLNELKEIADEVSPNAFILLGDIKNSIARISNSEWRLVPFFMERLRSMSNVIIVPGNHDSNIKNLIPSDLEITSAHGLIIDDTLLMHGHALPLNLDVKRIIIGHTHPKFVKEGSVLNGNRVWIFAKMADKEIIFLPAFNKYISSHTKYEDSIIPLLDKVKIKESLVVTLEGSIIDSLLF